jgi:hypothetical protein
MKWQKWLENWDMTSLKINLKFLEMNWEPKEPDIDAAWELYIELLTRITTQYLEPEEGDEKTAIESVYKIFDLTRITIKKHKRDCIEFTKIAILVLNQIIRPFTAKWHKEMLAGAFEKKDKRKEFRDALRPLQDKLRIYTKMLADMAGVEDLTALEEV